MFIGVSRILFLRYFKTEIRKCMLYLYDFREEIEVWGLFWVLKSCFMVKWVFYY